MFALEVLSPIFAASAGKTLPRTEHYKEYTSENHRSE